MSVTFLAYHPGSINMMTGIIEQLRVEKVKVDLLPLSPYAATAWRTDHVYENSELLDKLTTDIKVLVYCPIGIGNCESNLIAKARELNIVTMGILDIFWLSNTDIKNRFTARPNFILAPDDSTAKQVDKIFGNGVGVATGSCVFTVTSNTKDKQVSKIKSIALISQPNLNHYNSPTHKNILTLLELINSNFKSINEVENIVICTHPRESGECIREFISRGDVDSRFTYNENLNTSEACKLVDAVLGTNSTVLVEQVLTGKPVLFYETVEVLLQQINNPKTIDNSSLLEGLPDNPKAKGAQFIIDKLIGGSKNV